MQWDPPVVPTSPLSPGAEGEGDPEGKKLAKAMMTSRPDRLAISLSANPDAIVAIRESSTAAVGGAKAGPAASVPDAADAETRSQMKKDVAETVGKTLKRYRRPDCEVGRISNDDDFKHLCRKVSRYQPSSVYVTLWALDRHDSVHPVVFELCGLFSQKWSFVAAS